MKKLSLILFPATILATYTLIGCVPANQTIAVLDGQTQDANRNLAAERGKTRDLYQTRESLEAQLAAKRSRKTSLEAADPVGNRDEIQRYDREIRAMEHHLARAL